MGAEQWAMLTASAWNVAGERGGVVFEGLARIGGRAQL
jgi:hypothetical protein